MLTAEQAIQVAASHAGPGIVVDQAWLGKDSVVAMFAPASEADELTGQGPTIIDLESGRMTYPGSATNPVSLIDGMIRVL